VFAWFGYIGGEKNILNYVYLIDILGGKGKEEEGIKIPQKPPFCFTPN